MSHADPALTPRARLRLARLIVEDGWSPAVAASMFMVSVPTARKWTARSKAKDRRGRPTGRAGRRPVRTAHLSIRNVGSCDCRLGPVQIGGELGVAPSTVHAVLVRCRMNRLGRIDRVAGEPIRRYERDHPGSMIHVDVTKFGNILGGGHRFLGRQAAKSNRSPPRDRPVE